MVSCFPPGQLLRRGLVSQKLTCSRQKCFLSAAHTRCEFDSALCQARWGLEQEMAKYCPDKTLRKKEELHLWEHRYSDNPPQCLWLSQFPPTYSVAWQRLSRHYYFSS